MKRLILILCLFSAGRVLADPDPQLLHLEMAYGLVHQEQQSLYQQFQMTLELRRIELQDNPASPGRSYSGMGVDSARGIDYDETIRLQRERQDRLQRYERDINQNYARYLELGDQKKRLLEQITALRQAADR
jgi:hypothetical protein